MVTNDDIEPRLTVVKHVDNDDGGTAVADEWTMHIRQFGFDVNLKSPFPGEEAPGTERVLTAGTYVISESGGREGYTARFGGACAPIGVVTLELAEVATCTVTNDDIGPTDTPTLKVIKHVVNDDGRTATADDFTVRVKQNGSDVAGSPQPGSEAGSTYALQAGFAYTVSEDDAPGYVRTISGDCTPDGTIILELDDHKTCTITNDDAPPVPPGGCLTYEDFSAPADLQLLADARVVEGALRLTRAEGNLTGYAWYGAPLPVANSFTSDFGFRFTEPGGNGGGADGITFAIQNTGVVATGAVGGALGYQGLPNSLVVEFDTFDNGPESGDPDNNHVAVHTRGTDPNGPGDGNDSLLGAASLTPDLKAGAEHRAHIAYANNELSISVDGTPVLSVPIDVDQRLDLPTGRAFVGFTAATGQGYENHDVLDWTFCPDPEPSNQARLKVVKHVVNDDGGTQQAEAFTMRVGGESRPGSESGTDFVLDAGEYAVSEDAAPGYARSFSGACDASGAVTLEAGDEKTCTVTNDDLDAPTLTVLKHVVNDDGGTGQADDFMLHVRQAGVDVADSPAAGAEGGRQYVLGPGGYRVSEDPAPGYSRRFSGDCAADGTVTLAAGDAKSCMVTNDDVAADQRVNLQGYSAARTDDLWGLTEPFLSETVGYAQDPANFGPAGVVQRHFDVGEGIDVASADTLAGVDVFFTGYVTTASYTDDEREALRDFVRRGGTIIATTDNSSHTMVDAFGLTQAEGSNATNVITEPEHPIADGPFGTVSEYQEFFDTGHYSSLGPDAHEIGRSTSGDATTLAVIERGALGPGSGAVIFVADVDVFSNELIPGGGSVVNATLIKNIFAFAAQQPPQPGLAIGDVSKAEGDAGTTAFELPVTLSAPAAGPVDVHWATAPDTAGDSDFTPASGDLHFAAGDTEETITVEVTGDTEVEPDERFLVNLSAATGARLVGPQGRSTILNDDAETPATTLKVIKRVINDDGGTRTASDFSLHVKASGVDVDGSPRPGSETGTTYPVQDNVQHVVSEDDAPGYVRSISGDCAPDGSIVVQLGEHKTCTITNDDAPAVPPGDCIAYQDFSPPDGLQLLGDAQVVGDALRLTRAEGGQVGYAWYGTRVSVGTSFVTDFRFRFTEQGGIGGADGITFAIQNTGVVATGAAGGGLGYLGLPNSAVVEFDTYYNGPESGDPDDNHVAVHTRGTDPNGPGDANDSLVGAASLTPNLKDGEVHHARIAYGGHQLAVFVDDLASPALTVPIDLGQRLDLTAGAAFVGFTSATGLGLENHDVLDWSFCPEREPPTLEGLTVVKHVVNDNGGTQQATDFSLHVKQGGADVPGSPDIGIEGGRQYLLAPGDYTVSEDPAPGYAQSFSGDCDADGDVTLAADDRKTCRITNDDVAPELTVVKQVVNDDGGAAGAADFTMRILGDDTDLQFPGSAAGTTRALAAGTYEVGETGPAGYARSFAGDCAPDGTVTLALGEEKTCTVVNDDVAEPPDTCLDTVSGRVFVTGHDPDFHGHAGAPESNEAGARHIIQRGILYATHAKAAPNLLLVTSTQDRGPNYIDPRLTLAEAGYEFDVAHAADADDGALDLRTVRFGGYDGIVVASDFGGWLTQAEADVLEERADDLLAYVSGGGGLVAFAESEVPEPFGFLPFLVASLPTNEVESGLAVTSFGAQLGLTDADVNGSVYHNFFSSAGALEIVDVDTQGTSDPADDQPVTLAGELCSKLRVVKHVVNDDGGTATASDWTMHIRAGGTDVTGKSPFPGTEAPGTERALTPGTYTVGESGGPSGYTASFSRDCANDGTITLTAGESKTCTVVNDDEAAAAPRLTVVKQVVNDDGGTLQASDFALHVKAGGDDVATSPQPGSAQGTTYTLDAGTRYTVSEDPVTGYQGTMASDCAADGTITLQAGDEKTCTITNNDIAPKLTVIKHVVNDDGGTADAHDFTMHIRADGTDLEFPGNEAPGTTRTLEAGTYTVSESGGPAGYAATISGDCAANGTVSLAVGDEKTCTITNNDPEPAQPTLKVVTELINNDGGTRVANSFDVAVRSGAAHVPGSPGPGNSAGTTYTLAPGAYTVTGSGGGSEYTVSIAGDCSAGGAVTLAAGDAKTCTVTFDDIAPTLTVVKRVDNGDGGTAGPGDWTMHITSTGTDHLEFPGSAAGTTRSLKAGSYTVSESGGPAGYTATFSGDCATGGDVTLELGETKTCTITNDDIAPKLTVIKHVVNDDGGTADAHDFTMHIRADGTDLEFPGNEAPGTTRTLEAGTYTVSESGGPAGYAATISGDCAANGTVSLAVGDETTCTITNDDPEPAQPTLKVIATVINDSGGTRTPSSFTIAVRSGGANVPGSPAPGNSTGTTYTLAPGAYTVAGSGGGSEYTVAVSGDCTTGGAVTLAAGDAKTCTVTFDDIAPRLTVVKRVVNNNGGARAAGEWTMHIRAAGIDVTFPGSPAGTTRTLRAGAYTVGETGPGGYTATIDGDCASTGAVTLALGAAKTCTITNDDDPPPPAQADLRITKTASDTTPFLGDTVVYTLTVANAGPAAASAVVVTDDVDGRLAPRATPAGCSAAELPGRGTRFTCALGDFVPGASRSVRLEVGPRMACTFIGTARDDRDRDIGSTRGDDVICGAGGADTFSGGRGDDALYGLAPLEGLPGTVPNTATVTSATPDANPANNRSAASLRVAAGADRGDDIDGGAGSDRLVGAAGTDDLNGGAGNDSLDGDAGNDALNGGGGRDELDGGRGSDIVKGGAGNDAIAANDGTRDTIDCGGGRDRAVVDRRDRVEDCETVRRR